MFLDLQWVRILLFLQGLVAVVFIVVFDVAQDLFPLPPPQTYCCKGTQFVQTKQCTSHIASGFASNSSFWHPLTLTYQCLDTFSNSINPSLCDIEETDGVSAMHLPSADLLIYIACYFFQLVLISELSLPPSNPYFSSFGIQCHVHSADP